MASEPPKGAVPSQFASLYVGDLHPDTTEAQLYEIFNAVGPVGSIRVCRDRTTRKSLGYGYINFHKVQDAERALDTLNYSSIKGRSCRLMWSQRDSSVREAGVNNVYIKNLDKNIDNKGLFDTFSLFGNILSCKVATYPDGTSKGYGFVQFETEESAKDAIQKVNGVQVGDLAVEVHEFKQREKEKEEMGSSFKNLYIKSFPKEWDDAKLKEVFGVFGELSAATVRTDWKGRPFGFVDFVTVEDAQKCVKEMHLKEMRSAEEIEEDTKSGKKMEEDQDGHPLHLLYVGKMQSKADRQAEWRKKSAEAGSKGGGGGKGGKGGYNSWGGGGGFNKGGKGGMPPMPPWGMKGMPMVSNPQQMMAVMQMMGKSPFGKGGPPMGKGGPMGGFPMGGKGMPPMRPQGPSMAGNEKLTLAALAIHPRPVQKQMIGERLYREVSKFQPDMAAKLTGMMLEMDNTELLMLLDSDSRMKRQIDQALAVLGPA